MDPMLRKEEVELAEFSRENLVRPLIQWLTTFVILGLLGIVLFA